MYICISINLRLDEQSTFDHSSNHKVEVQLLVALFLGLASEAPLLLEALSVFEYLEFESEGQF